jgi:hypothetical protein
LNSLKASLLPITPANLLDNLFFGLSQWLSDPTLPAYLSPTEDSILPQLASLTLAFHQQNQLSWSSLVQGQIATGWSNAYRLNFASLTNKKRKTPLTPEAIHQKSRQWCHKCIPLFWQLSKAVWTHRNWVVHGQTTLAPSKEMMRMQESVCHHYLSFHNDAHSSNYLFNRDLALTLSLRRDNMACWLHSMEEAVLTQNHRQQHCTNKITTYFQPRPRPPSHSSARPSLFLPAFSAAYSKKQQPPQPR